MRIKKTSQTTILSAQVVNTYSDSTSDAYSCDYINNTFGYNVVDNGSAVKTGRKINGKEEWVKAFSFNPSSSTLSKTLGFTLSSVTITDIRGTERGTSGNYFSVNLGATAAGGSTISPTWDIRVSLSANDNKINITANGNMNYVHIEIYYYYN